MPVPEKILEFVDRFECNLEAYKQGRYNETQVRREFIDPFFEALGWDVANRQGYAEAYKDVVHEDAIRVGRATKAPDYSFRIGGMRKFFLEAKKPSIDLKDDTHPAYQLRRYAWSAKLPLSILTDFEEFAVYDCRTRPAPTDKASHSRILYVTYTEYAERWEEIAGIFSREAILKGSFDRYVESKKNKRGTAEVDSVFLEEIERWRDQLARNIALRNPGLTQRELNFAVQRTIDRIIFLRICEDRGVEPYGKLMALRNGHQVYERMSQLFRQADDRYNSGLFHFQPEKDRPGAYDAFTPNLILDDEVLKDLVKNLYYPDSPYEFSVLPANILGQIYEQFLGKIIRLTPGHRAVVEYKPEVRKAGGVYYTPIYIVDYIVQQTVGKLLEGQKPGPKGGISSLRILDPACGSGSFLLGAYQFLLDWHRDQYVNDDPFKWAKGRSPRLYQRSGGDWRLTTDERKRILLNNIFGVDIDSQAVEVTKLSLLLKVLEGEDEQTVARQLSMLQKRVLPDLANNIKCGNSLIGPDFYEGRQMSFRDEEEMYRVNAFDWEAEFPEIMREGGFDAVIGNPPWGASFSERELDYLRTQHRDIIVRMTDSYLYFIRRSAQLLNKVSIFGMIVPSTLLTQADAELLRRFLVETFRLGVVINLGEKVFGPKVLNTSTILVFTAPKMNSSERQISVGDLRHCMPEEKPQRLREIKTIDCETWLSVVRSGGSFTFFTLNLPAVELLRKLSRAFPGLQEIIEGKIQRGISPDYSSAFVVENDLAEREHIDVEILRPAVIGKHISRYGTIDSSTSIIYLTREDNILEYPNTEAHLNRYRGRITCREVVEGKHPWFSLHRPRNPEIFKAPKFIGLTTTKKICIALDEDVGYYATDALYLFGVKRELALQERFVLGVLLSTCFQFLYQVSSQGEQRVIPQIKAAKLYGLPFPIIDLRNPVSKVQHDQMVPLVTRMLDLHKKLPEAKTPQTQTVLQRQIETTDRQIDELVYELYDLTEEEIEIVEKNLR
ncbi:MAG: N-6 DNA methylase [Candidatus Latescibacterota bacterium]